MAYLQSLNFKHCGEEFDSTNSLVSFTNGHKERAFFKLTEIELCLTCPERVLCDMYASLKRLIVKESNVIYLTLDVNSHATARGESLGRF